MEENLFGRLLTKGQYVIESVFHFLKNSEVRSVMFEPSNSTTQFFRDASRDQLSFLMDRLFYLNEPLSSSGERILCFLQIYRRMTG
jgi:hypothetical protein